MSEACAFEGCERPAQERAAYCRGHMKQREQGRPLKPLREQGLTPKQVLVRAALALADVAAEKSRQDYTRAEYRLLMAAIRYARRNVTSSNKSPRLKLPS